MSTAPGEMYQKVLTILACQESHGWFHSTFRHRKLLKRDGKSLRNGTRDFLTVVWWGPQCPQCRTATWRLPTVPACLWNRDNRAPAFCWHWHQTRKVDSPSITFLSPICMLISPAWYSINYICRFSIPYRLLNLGGGGWSNTTSFRVLCFVLKPNHRKVNGQVKMQNSLGETEYTSLRFAFLKLFVIHFTLNNNWVEYNLLKTIFETQDSQPTANC